MEQPVIFNKDMKQVDCAIIMPVYNRAHFMPQAFKSLREQTYTSWRLIIVDDGSVDNALEIISELATSVSNNEVLYIKQKNGGAGAARATGQKYLEGEVFVAFFDSDDYWLSSYLESQISVLKNNANIDWIFCPCERVKYGSGEVISKSTFYDDSGVELDFLKLRTKKSANANIFEDQILLAKTHIRQPINAGFQNSVIRRAVVNQIAIPPCRIGEDRQFLLLTIAANFKIAYVEQPNVIYHVHDENVSATNPNDTEQDKLIRVYTQLADSYRFAKENIEQGILKDAIDYQISHIEFWHIAYSI